MITLARFFTLGLVALTAAACALPPRAAVAAPTAAIMIMAEDGDSGTVPRNSRVVRRVLERLSDSLNAAGFHVIDETAVTLDEFVQGRNHRPLAELIDIAKRITTPPLQGVVTFQVYAAAEDRGYTAPVRVRIGGSIIEMPSGRRLGSIDVKTPGSRSVNPNCNRECLLEKLGDWADDLATDAAPLLADKIMAVYGPARPPRELPEERPPTPPRANTAPPSAGDNEMLAQPVPYALEFRNFSQGEMLDIEEYFTRFRGYSSHRSMDTSGMRWKVWYETRSPTNRVERYLKRMVEDMNVRAVVRAEGAAWVVEKSLTR